MTPHFFPQADPVMYVSGKDCTRISNAKNSECSGQRCIVSKCNFGWHPNLARDTCVLNAGRPSNPKLRVLKREDSLTTNVVANANVSSDLVAKVGAIVSLVSGLNCTPSQIPASSSSSAAVISDLLGDVVDGTSTLIVSTNIPSLLNNLDALLNVSSLLSSTISSCGCGKDLGLPDLEDGLSNIVAALLNLKSWCSQSVPSDFNLSGLLSGLGLNNSTVAAVVSSDLVVQIKSLVGLVVGLAGVSSSLSPTSPSNLSSINANITNSIVNATVYIVNATTVPSLLSSIGALVNVNGLASSLLDNCGCVIALGLGAFVADLAQVANATLRMQDWCDTYPVANISATGNSSIGASTSNSITDELTIDLGLSNLLDLLGSVKSDIVVSGTATDTLANAGGLSITTGDVRRQITADADASVTSELLTKIGGLVSTVLTLVQVAPSKRQTSAPVVDTSVIDNVLRATKALLRVSSLGTIEPEVNGLVAASLASVKTLDNCGCVDNLGLAATYDSLVQIAEASLDLQDWCHGHPVLVSPLSSSSPSNSYGQPSTTTTSTVKEPVIVGLTKLLYEFEIRPLRPDDAHLTNSSLGNFGIGPNELRRHVTREI
jgi:hypothetical protein